MAGRIDWSTGETTPSRGAAISGRATSSTGGGRINWSGGGSSAGDITTARRRARLAEKKQAEEEERKRANIVLPFNGAEVPRDEFLKEFDSYTHDNKRRAIKDLKTAAEASEDPDVQQRSSEVLKFLQENGRTKGSVLDFVASSNDAFIGGLTRGLARTANLAVPGDLIGEEDLQNIAPDPQKVFDRERQGATFGSAQKGVVDVASLAIPAAGASKVASGTNFVNKLSQGGRLSRAAARGIPLAAESLAGTGVDTLQEVGRGNETNLARSAAVGGAVDVGVELVLPRAAKLLKKGSTKAAANQIKKAVSAADEAQVIRNNGFIRDSKLVKSIRNNGVVQDISRKFIDTNQPLYRMYDNLEASGVLPKGVKKKANVLYGNVKRSYSLADNKRVANVNYQDAIRGLKSKSDLKAFNDYAIARRELDLISKGRKTGEKGRREAFEQALKAGENRFSQSYDAMAAYYRDLLGEMVDSGLVDKEVADKLLRENPDYIRLNREIERLVPGARSGGGAASISSSTGLQKLSGSTAKAVNPVETMVTRTREITREIERVKAANFTIEALESVGEAQRITGKIGNQPNISTIVNGKKVTYKVPKEVEIAAKAWDVEVLGPTLRALSIPTRIFKTGTTGLNPAFLIPNFLKDQAGSFVLSEGVGSPLGKTGTHSIPNIVGSFIEFASEKTGREATELLAEYQKYAGSQTFFDVARAPKKVAREVLDDARKANVSWGGRTLTTAANPKRWFRAAEDAAKYTEDLTRFQNFRGAFNKAVKEGMSKEDALIEATYAARNNSIDFYSGGDWSRGLNVMLPYFNATIQGGRTLARRVSQNPFSTSAKFLVAVQAPLVMATAHNLSDPERAQRYKDIPDYEKENNFVILDIFGSGKDIKIPMAPGLSDLATPMRRTVESFYGFDEPTAKEMFTDIAGAFSPIDIESPSKALSSVTPQIVKPSLQAATNSNLFTGRDIVPDYLSEREPDAAQQYFDSTSGFAKEVGKLLDISPIKVEQFVRDTGGELAGRPGINAIDNVLNQAGVIPEEDIGGMSIPGSIGRRFADVADGQARSEFFDKYDDVKARKSKASRRITELVKEGQVNTAIKQAEEFNASIEGEFQKIIDFYGDLIPPEDLELLEGLRISTSKRAIDSRARY